jgi:hypothetical protein
MSSHCMFELHAVILCLSVLHAVPLTVCDVDQEPATQLRYCDPVKRRQASQKVTDCVRHEARGVSRLRARASTPTCRSLLALPSTPPLT